MAFANAYQFQGQNVFVFPGNKKTLHFHQFQNHITASGAPIFAPCQEDDNVQVTYKKGTHLVKQLFPYTPRKPLVVTNAKEERT